MPSKLYSFFSPRRAVSADLSGPAVLPPPAGELVVLADSSPRPDLLPGELPPPIAREDGDDLPPMICRAVFEEISVHANGDIVCSCADPTGRRVYGNVYRDRIADVYNGPMYRAIREWQLQSKPDCWCPVTQFNCAGRIARASAAEKPTNRHVKMLQLEPVSHCNLRCPSCPVTTHFPDPDLEERRDQILPLAVMLDLIDQLPHLETLLFYNFGEAVRTSSSPTAPTG
jgi:MoaA/NifB/PqqE/SkfB family radical SAM enzyme